MSEFIKNRYDFALLFDATNSNPNGDPDFGGQPRVNVVNSHGIVSPVCIKYKVKRELALMCEQRPGYELYISPGKSLNARDEEIMASFGIDPKSVDFSALKKDDPEVDKKILAAIAEKYADVRMFGAVMTRFSNLAGAANNRGIIQLGYGESISPVDINTMTISRSAVTTDAEREGKGKIRDNTLGSVSVIPYALYRMNGVIDPLNSKAGLTEEDLNLFWTALENIFMHDNAANRSGMRVRKLVVFKHETAYGNCNSADLMDRVGVKELHPDSTPSSFEDYEILINDKDLPSGVSMVIRK